MSHRITKEYARSLRDKELELQQMQREGKTLPRSNRRNKKYLLQVRKEKGFWKYLAERHRMQDHVKAAAKFDELAEGEL